MTGSADEPPLADAKRVPRNVPLTNGTGPDGVRILRTGDWHIGATLRGHDGDGEHGAVLDRVVGIAAERKVDASVRAGDVFDAQNSSGRSQGLFYRTFAALSRIRSGPTVVVVVGNHDSAVRLEAPHPLLAAFDVQVVGDVRRQIRAGTAAVRRPTKAG